MSLLLVSKFINSMPDDQFRVVSAFLLMLPSGWMFQFIPAPFIRLLYSLFLGVIFQHYIYCWSMLHVIGACVVNLLILKTVNYKKVGRYAMIYNFAHNSLIHLYRLIFEYDNWSVEISVIFMITMCKFTSFAYAWKDAQVLKNKSLVQNEEKDKNVICTSISTSLSESQKMYMIPDYTIIEYLSYIFFFPTSIMGPVIEFRDFINFINLKEEYGKIPSTLLPSIGRLVTGFILFGVYMGLKEFGHPDSIIDEEGRYSIFKRFIFYVCGCVHEYKYIGGFCLAEASAIASGFSYNGEASDHRNDKGLKTQHDRWGKVRSISIINLHLVYKPSEFFHHWNISVHFFLKRYVYLRLIPQNATFAQKQAASSQTFFISAFWHGFHPTYFVVFFHFYFFTLLEQQLCKVFNSGENKNLKSSTIFLIRSIILIFIVPYHCLMFICLDYVKLIKFLKAVYCFGTVVVVGLNLILFVYRKLFITNHNKQFREKSIKSY